MNKYITLVRILLITTLTCRALQILIIRFLIDCTRDHFRWYTQRRQLLGLPPTLGLSKFFKVFINMLRGFQTKYGFLLIVYIVFHVTIAIIWYLNFSKFTLIYIYICHLNLTNNNISHNESAKYVSFRFYKCMCIKTECCAIFQFWLRILLRYKYINKLLMITMGRLLCSLLFTRTHPCDKLGHNTRQVYHNP